MKTKYRVYCDTSIFGGVFDNEFAEASKRFFKLVTEGKIKVIISPVVEREIDHWDIPSEVKKLYDNYFSKCEIAEITKEVLALQEAYIKENILSSKWEDDALHVATATVYRCDIIVSWNFKHIVNFKKIPLYNAVNTLKGYQNIQIYSPLEVIEDE